MTDREYTKEEVQAAYDRIEKRWPKIFICFVIMALCYLVLAILQLLK